MRKVDFCHSCASGPYEMDLSASSYNYLKTAGEAVETGENLP